MEQQRVCRNCAHPLREGARFCNHCGTPVLSAPQVQTPNFAAPTAPIQKMTVASQPKKKKHTALIIIICVLGLFLMIAAGVCAFLLLGGLDWFEDTFLYGSSYSQVQEDDKDDDRKHRKEATEPTEKEHAAYAETTEKVAETLPAVTPAETTETPTAAAPEETEPANLEYLKNLNALYDGYFDFTPNEQGLVIPDSDVRKISAVELYGMTEHQVCMARNEIYARHGMIFQTQKYKDYYSFYSWYSPTASNPALSDIEKENVSTIKAYEHLMGWD